jgi:hypothetical protein
MSVIADQGHDPYPSTRRRRPHTIVRWEVGLRRRVAGVLNAESGAYRTLLVGQYATHVDADRRGRTNVAAILGPATGKCHEQN